MNQIHVISPENAEHKSFQTKLLYDNIYYFIYFNLSGQKLEISCHEEKINNIIYSNTFTKEHIQNLHKYFQGGTIEEIFEGLIDLVPNFRIEKEKEKLKIIVSIKYLSKEKDLILELKVKAREEMDLSKRVKFLEDLTESLLNENKILRTKLLNFEKKIFSKIILYKELKSVNVSSGICSIITLSNGDIALGKRNGVLSIYESNNLDELCKVQAHCGGNTSIYSLLELSDNTIITCGGNKTLKNYFYNKSDKKLEEIQELIGKEDSGYICRAVELPNKNIVTSDCNHIFIWKKNDDNKFEIIKDISDLKGAAIHHLLLINKKYIIAHNNNGILRIYNALDNFKMEKEINNIRCNLYMHRFSIIDCDIFCLAGDENIYFFSISKMEMIYNFNAEGLIFHSILKLSNDSLLFGTNSKHLYQFRYDGKLKEISKKENIHSSIIWGLILLQKMEDKDIIISISDDCFMKKWILNYNSF